jgi:Uma2 family endonuclease
MTMNTIETPTLAENEQLQAQLDAAEANPLLDGLPNRVEVQSDGSLFMSPTPTVWHDLRAQFVRDLMKELAPEGVSVCPASIKVTDSVSGRLASKAADAGWSRHPAYRTKQPTSVVDLPPWEIVVEVLSPNFRKRQVEAKREEYITAGVKEVWIVELDGTVLFFIAGPGRQNQSVLIPKFPNKVD